MNDKDRTDLGFTFGKMFGMLNNQAILDYLVQQGAGADDLGDLKYVLGLVINDAFYNEEKK